MIKEGKFVLNKDTGETVDIKQSDFEFVQKDKRIHDVKFSSKATTFFKDSLRRFVKSKPALAGGIIVGLLLVLAIIVPEVMPKTGAYDVDRNTAGGNVAERFIQPKLFPAGTGFWDGTIKKTGILYDTENQVPQGYREGVFFNLETYERVENSAGELGYGGYVNAFCADTRINGNFYSSYYTFDFSSDYTIKADFLNETVTGYISSPYRIVFEAEDDEASDYYLTSNGRDTFISDTSISINVKDVLAAQNFDFSVPASYRIRIEIQANSNGIGNLLIQDVIISSNSTDQEEIEALKAMSFEEGNEVLLRDRTEFGAWNTTSGRSAYKVNYTYCNFTYDQYEDIYGIQEKTYTVNSLLDLNSRGLLEFNLSGSTVPASSDEAVLAERFIPVGNSPIVKVIEQIGDATRNSNGTYGGYTLRCEVLGYRYYGYDSMPLFLFGTNTYRKDYFKLIFVSLRFSFLLAIGVSAVNITFGLVWGSISGYFGGWTDILMERFCEILSSLPSTVIITLCILYGAEWNWGDMSDVLALMVALFLTGWMGVAARTRTQFYRFKGREYVLASRTLGAKDTRLIFRHILPNSMGTIITGSILMIPSVVYTEASIAYLGLGLQGQNMFGVILSEANIYYQGENTYLLIIPTIIMAFLLISFNLFGNGLRDAFNPTLKGSE